MDYLYALIPATVCRSSVASIDLDGRDGMCHPSLER